MTEGFLSRWSRRKQAATQAVEQVRPPPPAESAVAREHAAEPAKPESRDTSDPSQRAPDPGAPVFDPASLPALESITAETDIRAFFAAGVPTELTRAALRRVWTSDPKIRDFVGLADYDWDFNTPGSMAGFGPLEGADALRAQVVRLGPDSAADSAGETSDHVPGAQRKAPASDASVHDRPSQPNQIMTEGEVSQNVAASQARDQMTRPGGEQPAATHQEEKPEDIQSITGRTHGGALPRS
jgi:hypothetical protein